MTQPNWIKYGPIPGYAWGGKAHDGRAVYYLDGCQDDPPRGFARLADWLATVR